MKTLEDWVSDHREYLDGEEPGEGHLEKFRHKLHAQQGMIRQRERMRLVFRVAAAVVVTAGLAWGLFYFTQLSRQAKEPIAGMPKELKEAELFYSQQLQSRYDAIRNLHFPDEAVKTKLLHDLNQTDDSFTRLQEDLKADPENEMTFDAMIKYYQTRLDVVNNVISNLRQVLINNHHQTLKAEKSHETIV